MLSLALNKSPAIRKVKFSVSRGYTPRFVMHRITGACYRPRTLDFPCAQVLSSTRNSLKDEFQAQLSNRCQILTIPTIHVVLYISISISIKCETILYSDEKSNLFFLHTHNYA